MVFQIPTKSDGTASYEMVITLDGVAFRVGLDYSTREECWYMWISDLSGNLLVSAVKVVEATDLFFGFTSEDLPAGTLFCTSLNGDPGPPGLLDLGQNFGLFYADRDELESDE
jgi:hypothetical protein